MNIDKIAKEENIGHTIETTNEQEETQVFYNRNIHPEMKKYSAEEVLAEATKADLKEMMGIEEFLPCDNKK